MTTDSSPDGERSAVAETAPDDSTGADERETVTPIALDRLGALGPVGRRVFLLAVVVGLFALAFGVGRGTVWLTDTLVGVGEPGTVSRLLVGVAGLQVLGFGVGLSLVIVDSDDPLSYLRVGELDQWVAFYGTAVGLGLMLLTTAATVAFQLLGIEPAESAAGGSEDPVYYLVLFVVSTFLAVPMEELFFRGLLQRTLEAVWHPAVAIGVASLLFVTVHTSVSAGDGGEVLVVGLFLSFGVVLGVSYHLTENLFVPLIGHVVYNSAQTLTRAVDVAT
jgi:membrane protease YdiL (CAAX protease family)